MCLKNWRIPKTTNIARFTIPTFSPLSDIIFYCYGCTKLETPVTVRTLCRETIQGLDVDAVATNTVKSRKWRNGASSRCFWGQQIVFTHRTEDLSHSKFSINYEIDYFFLLSHRLLHSCTATSQKLSLSETFLIYVRKKCFTVWLLVCSFASRLNIFLP